MFWFHDHMKHNSRGTHCRLLVPSLINSLWSILIWICSSLYRRCLSRRTMRLAMRVPKSRILDRWKMAGKSMESRKLRAAEQASRSMLLKDKPVRAFPLRNRAPMGRVMAASRGNACSCCASFLLYVTCGRSQSRQSTLNEIQKSRGLLAEPGV